MRTKPGNGTKTVITELPIAPKNKVYKNGSSKAKPAMYKQRLNGDGEELIDARTLLRVLTEVKNGNFTVRMPKNKLGINGKISDTLNEIIDLNETMTLEFTRAGRIIGKQG